MAASETLGVSQERKNAIVDSCHVIEISCGDVLLIVGVCTAGVCKPRETFYIARVRGQQGSLRVRGATRSEVGCAKQFVISKT